MDVLKSSGNNISMVLGREKIVEPKEEVKYYTYHAKFSNYYFANKHQWFVEMVQIKLCCLEMHTVHCLRVLHRICSDVIFLGLLGFSWVE